MFYKMSLALLLMFGVFMFTKGSLSSSGKDQKGIVYPNSRQDSQVDSYHGVEVKDPYRYLEESSSDETKEWVRAQNLITFNYLDQIPQREAIRKRLNDLWNYERFGLVSKEGSRYFLCKNDGLQNQDVLYFFDKVGDVPKLLLDPNNFSSDGTSSLSFYSPSHDGNLLAYGISKAGSDWVTIKLLDVENQRELDEEINWVKFSDATWLPDGTGFYYSRYDQPEEGREKEALNFYQKVYFHKVGTSQNEDALVYDSPDHKDWVFGSIVSEDGKYLIIDARKGSASENAIFYKKIGSNDSWKELFSDFNARYHYIGNDGTTFWFKTDLGAPKGKVVAVDLKNPSEKFWKELIPESDNNIQYVQLVGNRFIVGYLKDVHSQIAQFDLDGTLEKEINLPSIGMALGFSGLQKDMETFYVFTSYTKPSTVYRYDFLTGESDLVFEPAFPMLLDDFEIKQVFYPSKDGVRIPMSLVSRKGMALDGNNPVRLSGYGGFNIPVTPAFSPEGAAWLEMGGVLAIANTRGGAEYGEEWHNAGRLQRKQNVFDDFIAAAEWLIEEKVTSPSKLAIIGGSNGGLLVGACVTQRPDLFGAAIPMAGVLDMLRYHLFTIGWAWVPEYGSSDLLEHFESLYKYSPLHNLQRGTSYPPTLILTADHDDRVVPAHSYKFAAAMQEVQGGDSPILIRIETDAGHGAGMPTSKRIDAAADRFAFLFKSLNM